MLQWTEAGGMTEVVLTDGDNDPFELLVDLLKDLQGTATPRYNAEVLTWWFGDKSQTLVMECGDIWEWFGN